MNIVDREILEFTFDTDVWRPVEGLIHYAMALAEHLYPKADFKALKTETAETVSEPVKRELTHAALFIAGLENCVMARIPQDDKVTVFMVVSCIPALLLAGHTLMTSKSLYDDLGRKCAKKLIEKGADKAKIMRLLDKLMLSQEGWLKINDALTDNRKEPLNETEARVRILGMAIKF